MLLQKKQKKQRLIYIQVLSTCLPVYKYTKLVLIFNKVKWQLGNNGILDHFPPAL